MRPAASLANLEKRKKFGSGAHKLCERCKRPAVLARGSGRFCRWHAPKTNAPAKSPWSKMRRAIARKRSRLQAELDVAGAGAGAVKCNNVAHFVDDPLLARAEAFQTDRLELGIITHDEYKRQISALLELRWPHQRIK